MIEMYGTMDAGIKRSHNEDAIALLPSHGLAVLADGMGGHNAGEVASNLAVETIARFIRKHLDRFLAPSSDEPAACRLLADAVREANLKVFSTAQSRPECSGMGTTVVASLFSGNRLISAHVGDSRMYRLRGEYLTLVTEDHSLVHEQMKRGLLTPIDAHHSQAKNIVTRAVGIAPDIEPDVHVHEVCRGDLYLICSDGLTDVVPDEAIRLTMLEYGHQLDHTAKELINLAKDAGGPDNIAIVLIRADAPFERKRGLIARLIR